MGSGSYSQAPALRTALCSWRFSRLLGPGHSQGWPRPVGYCGARLPDTPRGGQGRSLAQWELLPDEAPSWGGVEPELQPLLGLRPA